MSQNLWNVGFCKYGDKCKIEHAQGDCGIEKCDRKTCHKRNMKYCIGLFDCLFA